MGCASSQPQQRGISSNTPSELLQKRMLILSRVPGISNYFKKGATFSDKYTITEKLLGKGGEGIVVEGYFNNKAHIKVAVKVIDRTASTPKTPTSNNQKALPQHGWFDVKKEVTILSKLQHPSIMKIYDFFESENIFIIVTELVPGGTLLERLKKRKHYTEKDARDILSTLVDVVRYLHRLNIVHRDLKPDNLLMTSVQEDFDFKLCDFGIATVCHGDTLTDPIGSINFVAPEVIKKVPYGKAVDVWAIGCIMFFLLSGELPFDDEVRNVIFDNITLARYKFEPTAWKGISEGAKDLLSKIFITNVQKRITLQGISDHPWMTCPCDLLSQSLDLSQHKIRSRSASSARMNSSTHGSSKINIFQSDLSLSQIRLDYESNRQRNESIFSSNYESYSGPSSPKSPGSLLSLSEMSPVEKDQLTF